MAICGIALWRAFDRCDVDRACHHKLEPGRARGAGIRGKPANLPWQDRDLRDFPASRGRPQGRVPLERRRREAGGRTRNLSSGRRNRSGRLGGRLPCRKDGPGWRAGARSRRDHRQQVRCRHAVAAKSAARRRPAPASDFSGGSPSRNSESPAGHAWARILPARRAPIGCMLNRLILLTAGNDAKLAELFAHAEVRRSDCATSAAPALSADWVTGADNPHLRGAL